MTPDDIQNLILSHLRRSNEPVSELYLQHRLEYDHATVTKERVTRAINLLLDSGKIRVADFVAVECERQNLLALADVQTKPDAQKPRQFSEEYRRTLSAETRQRISEGQRRRHAERLEASA